MSYEGRTVFICDEGHIEEHGVYDEYYFYEDCLKEKSEDKNCFYCGKPLMKVGSVDDTNGEASAHFWKEAITPRKDLERSFKDGVYTIRYLVPTYKIHFDNQKWFNYETGEEYGDFDTSIYEEYQEQN